MSAVQATPSLTPELLDLMQYEKVIEQGLSVWLDVSAALLAIKVGKKYLALGHPTFEDYCRDRWSMSRQHAHRLIVGVATVEAIERAATECNPGVTFPTPETEKQVRPLTALGSDEEKAAAWAEAVERSDGEQPTAATVVEVVRERTPQPVPKPAPKVNGKTVEGAPPHPAAYSDAVLYAFRDLLDMHANPIEATTILDPFAGTGRIHELQEDEWTTIGVELEREWADLHPDTIHGDSTNLGAVVFDAVECEQVDVIATSPAYGNRLADHYEAYDPEARRSYSIDLGRKLSPGSGAGMQWGNDYRYLHETVWRECVDLLAPGGLFLLNCKDHQRDGSIQAVTGWHVRQLVDLGLVVIDLRTLPVAGLASTTAAKLSELVVAFRKAAA